MCTVVVRWFPGTRNVVLALRDELTSRLFDEPADWWPDEPGVVGGRDRLTGGTWCATDLSSAATAVALNRTRKPIGEPGAASRGGLPLVAARHGRDWPAHLDLTGMASFALVLASPNGLTLWEFDGVALTETALTQGTHMFTSGPAERGRSARHLPAFRAAETVGRWRELVTEARPGEDPDALLVRYRYRGSTFATVFGQTIEAEPGQVAISHSRTPWDAETWSDRSWPTR